MTKSILDLDILDFLVIGSGPSGVTAAKVLLERGLRGKIVDSGTTLSSVTQGEVIQLASKPFQDWTSIDLAKRIRLESSELDLKNHAGRKLLFGSDHVYSDPKRIDFFGVDPKLKTKLPITFSKGGFSNVWGATFFPLAKSDEIKTQESIPQEYYDYVADFVPVVAFEDELAKIYPIPKRFRDDLPTNQFAKNLQLKWKKNQKKFKANFGTFGLPRLALRTFKNAQGFGCQNCGFCASGCVYRAIWNSEHELEKLAIEREDIYVNNFLVEEIHEFNSYITVKSNNGDVFAARKIFVAAGAYASTLLLMSNNFVIEPVELQDTQVTLVPFFVPKKQVAADAGFVLSQGFLHLANPKESGTELSVQLIGYNRDFSKRLRQIHPILKIIPNILLNQISLHLGVALVYQKADHSGKIQFEKSNGLIKVTEMTENLKPLASLPVWQNLKNCLKSLGLVPLVMFAQVLPVGFSFHLGSLRSLDGKLMLNELGSLKNHKNIHVVDGCALELIVPGSITNTIMANAAKICSQVSF